MGIDMQIFISKKDLDSSYSKFSDKTIKGCQYEFIGVTKKTYGAASRLQFAVKAIAKTMLTLGLGLISEWGRSDWKFFLKAAKYLLSIPAIQRIEIRENFAVFAM
jgi:hypothetical protein